MKRVDLKKIFSTFLVGGVCVTVAGTCVDGARAADRADLFGNTPFTKALDPAQEASEVRQPSTTTAPKQQYRSQPQSSRAAGDVALDATAHLDNDDYQTAAADEAMIPLPSEAAVMERDMMEDDIHSRIPAERFVEDSMLVSTVMDVKDAENRVMVTKASDLNGEPLSLRDAVAEGVWSNPEYNAVANNRRATDAEKRQAKGLYYPSVDFRADTGYEYTDDPSTRAGAGDDTESLYRYESGLTLTQMLFDGNESYFENRRQESRVESAAHRVREVTEFVALDIVQAYLDVYRQRQLMDIARRNVAEHVRILDQINDSSTAGRTTQADVEQARSRLASARASEAITLQDLKFAEANFIREVGHKPPALGMPLVPYDSLLMNVDEEVETALAKSPTLDIFEADIEVADAEYRGAKSEHFPELDLQLNARQGHDINGTEGRDSSASALVVMNWNLYRGGIDTARVKELVQRKATVKEQRADAARGIENDVRQTWARMKAARTRAKQFEAQIVASQDVVDAYKDQFDLNRRTLLDVLDAQNELFVSQTNKMNAEFLEMFAVYRILALRGALLPTLNVNYPQEVKADIL